MNYFLLFRARFLRILSISVFVIASLPGLAQTVPVPVDASLLRGPWTAHWIECPGTAARAYGVFHFRKTIELSQLPNSLNIHVSADNRYILFVNGKEIGRGPARSSLYNWNFESYNIGPYLRKGKNVIAAQVWNMGEYAPVAQISNQTGFLLQADDAKFQEVNTDVSWKVLHDLAYAPCALNTGATLHSYFVTGPGDAVHGLAYPWGWESLDYDDSSWTQAAIIGTPVVTQGYGTDNLWTMAPRSIPQMETKMERLSKIVSISGMQYNGHFLNGDEPLIVPPNTKVSILLDQSYETIGYPNLLISQGKGAEVKLTYAEALVDSNGVKGNRDEVKGKTIKGLFDIYYPDGGTNRKYSPLWLRTFRYLQLDIHTGIEPLKILDLYNNFTAYPFVRKAAFSSSDHSLDAIWEVGWRTARLCAGENYFDCPYYEQLQYEGDTRIQALISMYNTSDDRLVRKAIEDFYYSRTPDGLTQGRYPSNRLQVIPPFSLWWVSMLYDYWSLRPDPAYVKRFLPATEQVLAWFENRIDTSKNMLGPLQWWNFVDWNPAFKNGVPDGVKEGNSAVITLQYAYTLQQAAKLFDYFGDEGKSEHYLALARRLTKGTYEQCFDTHKMEMANTPAKNSFSQHAGIMAILADAIPVEQEQEVLDNLLKDSLMSQATFYYRFYLTRAMIKVGKASDYYGQLMPWRNMLKMGLTTFAEKPEPTRSDCHAWSASPVYDFLATICGIMPDAPGFQKVVIQPALGGLNEVKGRMPSPLGMISIALKLQKNGGVEGTIELPKGLPGRFVWQNKNYQLKAGKQNISIP